MSEVEDDAGAQIADADSGERSVPSAGSDRTASKPRSASAFRPKIWWLLPIAIVIEFGIYGHDGRLEICVGKTGTTDFSLVGQTRSDENRWKFPRCETRDNLGLRDREPQLVPPAIEQACRGATIFAHAGEAKACVAQQEGWEHRVEGHFVPPWNPAYYEHLFWFLR